MAQEVAEAWIRGQQPLRQVEGLAPAEQAEDSTNRRVGRRRRPGTREAARTPVEEEQTVLREALRGVVGVHEEARAARGDCS
jgi:hypothetical protein